jgi:hypothetical protein
MNEQIIYVSRLLITVLIIELALLLPFGVASAESAKENGNTAMLPPPMQEDQLVLEHRLRTARRDIEAFYVFADNFRTNGELKTLAQMQSPVDDFLKKHVDNLLAQNVERSTLDTSRLTAEIMFIKTRLFICLNKREAARNTIIEMKKRFGAYPKISVELPGRKTTLDEGIRLLDEELTKTAKVR